MPGPDEPTPPQQPARIAEGAGLRILWIATKPPWPPTDGGRLLAALTVEALAEAGHAVTVVAPLAQGAAAVQAGAPRGCRLRLVHAPLPDPLAVLLRAVRSPWTIARHRGAAMCAAIEELLLAEPFDAVHAEQLQALSQARGAFARGVPVLLRAQNVESDLWLELARHRRLLSPVLRREARRLAAWEGAAVRRATHTVALTERDAERLRELAGEGARVERVPAPFPAELPAGSTRLAGEPAVVLLGGDAWAPNRDQVRWFVAEAWPRVRAALPGARLHLFGALAPMGPQSAIEAGIEAVPAPLESREAFAPGAVLVVPLRVASGVRMKILEAWARGVAVVASPAAAAGLDAADGRELLLAADGAGFADALVRLQREPGLGAALGAAGRSALRSHHAPDRVAAALAAAYRVCAAAGGSG